ncbi:MAG: 5'-3' exonuclease [Verrucomicrobia bacterium]|nr:5'-3' exonuclease [Verrucomicrobiota bacterium]
MTDQLLLVDAFSLIYRAFYAIRVLNAPDGCPVNAIFGFTKMLRKIIATRTPTHCAVVFDCGAPQRRLELLPSYKEQRPPTPPALESQLDGIRDVLGALQLFVAEIEGEEADDIIATLAVRAARDNLDVLIASQDKDFFQIVGPRIRLLRPENGEAEPVDAAAVVNRLGVRPEQMVDYLSLIGDSVDNIPGVPGVGPKTAADLLQRHGSVDELIAAAGALEKPKLRESLLGAAERLRLNRSLIRLETDLPLPWPLEALKIRAPEQGRLRELFGRYGFRSLLAELEKPAGDNELLLNL